MRPLDPTLASDKGVRSKAKKGDLEKQLAPNNRDKPGGTRTHLRKRNTEHIKRVSLVCLMVVALALTLALVIISNSYPDGLTSGSSNSRR